MQNKKGFLALFLNSICLGTYGIWVKLLQNTFSAYQQVAIRSIIAFLFSVMLALILKSNWKFHKKHQKHFAFYLFSFVVSTILFTVGVTQTTIAISIFDFYIGSILSAFLIGLFFFGEALSVRKICSVVFILLALCILSYPHLFMLFAPGFLASIGSGIFDGIGNGFKKYFGGKIERPVLIVYQIGATLLITLVLLLFARQPLLPTHASFLHLSMLFIYGIIFLAVAYLSMYGFQHFNLNLGTIVISLELFWAPVFAFFVFSQTLTVTQLIGGVFIGAAIVTPYIKLQKIFLYRS